MKTKTGLPTLKMILRKKAFFLQDGAAGDFQLKIFLHDDTKAPELYNLQDYAVASRSFNAFTMIRRDARTIQAKVLNPSHNINTLQDFYA